MNPLLLRGVKILDFSWLLPGPFCSHLLAELGAEVIRVEAPGNKGVLQFFPLLKNKKKQVFNLKAQKDLIKVKSLIQRSDVILEGFRPGVMSKLKVGFKEAKKLNPKIIYCSLTGYGQKGEDLAGHDLNYLSESGFLRVLAVGGKPKVPGIPLADLMGGVIAALQIAAALSRKNKKALYLDVSISGATRKFLTPFEGPILQAMQNLSIGGLARYKIYETKEGRFISVAALEDKFWEKLSKKMQIPRQILDSGELTLSRWLGKKFKEKSQKQWCRLLKDPNYCVSPVL